MWKFTSETDFLIQLRSTCINKLLEKAVALHSEWQDEGVIQKGVRSGSRIGTNNELFFFVRKKKN